jgi:glycerophosphoryl diester phosphodiesterase
MKILGHRGAKGEIAENTLKSIQHAITAGVGAIEIDVHLTKDGKLAVIHDDSVDRTTNGIGKIIDLTMDELKKLDAGEGQTIPTLQEVIDLIKDHPITFFIEVKALKCEELIVKHIEDSGIENRTIVKSFIHRIPQKVKELNPKIKTACLMYGLPIDPVAIIKACNGDGISISAQTIDKELVKKCHDAGLTVTTWNINDEKLLPYFQDMGVDFAGTDFPTTICKAIE